MIKRVKVRVNCNLNLPRFFLKKGDTWEVRVDRFKRDGFSLGGGFIENDNYEVTGWI